MRDTQNGHERTVADLRECRATVNRVNAENIALRRALTTLREAVPGALSALHAFAGALERDAAHDALERAHDASEPA